MEGFKLKSANLKIQRAAKHIDELSELLREQRPFTYVLETNTETNGRTTYAKKNVAVVEEAMVVVGDALYNLRSALDHAYWEIVSPHAAGDRGECAVQFPFSKTAARLQEAVKNRLAHKVSPEFFALILALKPHGEPGGNDLLYLLHDENGVDKHRTLIPVGDYTRLSSDSIRLQVPDFPRGLVNFGFGQSARDLWWPLSPAVRASLGDEASLAPIFEQELDVLVNITFTSRSPGNPRPLVPTLHQLTNVTRDVINRIAAYV